jgi:hypothetical protein
MAPSSNKRKRQVPYRWRIFTHWLNLSTLVLGGAAAWLYDPSILLALGPLEVGLLWILPDLPPIRQRIDKAEEARELAREREYYMEQLWGLRPMRQKSLKTRVASIFTEVEEETLEERVLNRRSSSFKEYQDLKSIIAKIHELEEVRNISIPVRDKSRLEQVLNGYLRFTLAARHLSSSLSEVDIDKLREEVEELNASLAKADVNLKMVLQERKRLKETQLAKMPKLQATLELFRTRADAIVYQMHNIKAQLLADPGTDVNAFLDELVERQEILSDPLGSLEADSIVRDMLLTASPPLSAVAPPSKSAAQQQQRN